jgi:DNA polymerase-1
VIESPTDEFETLVEIVTDKMENAIPFDVPIKVNISSGLNWEEAH